MSTPPLHSPRVRAAEEWEARPPTPGSHPAWPHHDPLAGIPAPPASPSRVPPVRWPQGDLDWIQKISDSPADPIPVPGLNVAGLIETGQLILFGGSLVNSATVATTITVRDGQDASGGFVAQLTIPASGNALLSLPRAGVIIELGLFITGLGGVVTGALYVAHLWKYPFTPATE